MRNYRQGFIVPLLAFGFCNVALGGGTPYLLVSDSQNETITRFDESGANLGVWFATGGNVDAAYIRWGPNGDLFASYGGTNNIQRFCADGTNLGVFANVNISSPQDMAFDMFGRLYVANFTSDDITYYDSAGNYLGVFVSGLGDPRGIAFDKDSNLYVAERAANRVRKFDRFGAEIGVLSVGLSAPYGVLVNTDDTVLVSSEFIPQIHKFSASGQSLGVFGTGPVGGCAANLAFGPEGNVYLSTACDNLYHWQPDGTPLGIFAVTQPGSGTGLAFRDTIIDSDADELPDVDDNCINVFNPDQLDTDGDGFGNACDADLSNDCVVNFLDVTPFRAAFFSTPASPEWNPNADLTGAQGVPDGIVNFLDLNEMKTQFFGAPGPAGPVNICSCLP